MNALADEKLYLAAVWTNKHVNIFACETNA
jgi:hypothetical protein